jgi:hypothetical protein
MSNPNPRRKWDLQGKTDAIIDVLTHIMKSPEGVGLNCVESDLYARELFQDPKIGKVDVPGNVKVVFLPKGDGQLTDRGSVVIELPSPGQTVQTPGGILAGHLRYAAGISLDAARKWDANGKPPAMLAFLCHVMNNPSIGSQCLNNEMFVRQLFEDSKIGNIQVPKGVKIVIVPPGEHDSLEFGSLVIENPGHGPLPAPAASGAPNPLLAYVVCCYSLWLD